METCRPKEDTFLLANVNRGLFGNVLNFKAKRAHYWTEQSLIETGFLTSK